MLLPPPLLSSPLLLPARPGASLSPWVGRAAAGVRKASSCKSSERFEMRAALLATRAAAPEAYARLAAGRRFALDAAEATLLRSPPKALDAGDCLAARLSRTAWSTARNSAAPSPITRSPSRCQSAAERRLRPSGDALTRGARLSVRPAVFGVTTRALLRSSGSRRHAIAAPVTDTSKVHEVVHPRGQPDEHVGHGSDDEANKAGALQRALGAVVEGHICPVRADQSEDRGRRPD